MPTTRSTRSSRSRARMTAVPTLPVAPVTKIFMSGQPGFRAQPLGDLRDLVGRVVGGEDVGLRRRVRPREALGGLVGDDEILTGLWVRALEHRDHLPVVLRGEPVQREVRAGV